MDFKILTEIANQENFINLKALKGNHFGKDILSLQCKANELIKFFEIDGDVQRELIDYHVADIQKYIQYGMEGKNIYFPPIILSARGRGTYDKDLQEYRLRFDEKLTMLDGQHRIKAFESIMKRLSIRTDAQSQAQLSYVSNFPFSVQIFMDITNEEEKQLFTDVNTKASKVSNTLLIMYKSDDLCSQLVKDIIENHPTIPEDMFEVRSKYTKTKFMTAATLHNIIVTLNDRLLHTQRADSKITEETYHIYKEKTVEFLDLLNTYFSFNLHGRSQSIIYIPKVLSGLAFFIADALEKDPTTTMEKLFEEYIKKIDWSHNNRDFEKIGLTYNPNTGRYSITNGVRGMKAIVEYLTRMWKETFVK